VLPDADLAQAIPAIAWDQPVDMGPLSNARPERRVPTTARAVRLARGVRAGQVAGDTLDDGGPGAIRAPCGGYEHSGFGRSMSPPTRRTGPG
jgi:hypothetical protein